MACTRTSSWVLTMVLGCALGGCRTRGYHESAPDVFFGDVVEENDELRFSTVAFTREGKSFCTGTLVSPYVVLSAAHCFEEGKGEVRAVLGLEAGEPKTSAVTSPMRSLVPTAIIKHEKYPGVEKMAWGNSHDLAIVTLPRSFPAPVTFMPWATFVQFPESQKSFSGTVAGFGRSHDPAINTLRKTDVTVIPQRKTHTLQYTRGGFKVPSPGRGDSGGPFLTGESEGEKSLLGVTSMGLRVFYGAATLWTDVRYFDAWFRAKGVFQFREGLSTWCESPLLPSEARATVNTLLEITNTKDCREAESVLGKREELDLSRRGLSDLWPLTVLRQLRSVNVSGNTIEDPTPLAHLTNLEELDVSNNRLTTLRGLSKLPRLKRVNATGNWKSPRDCPPQVAKCDL